MFSVVATTRNSSTTQRNRRTTREKWTVTWFLSCAVACLTVVVVRSHPILKSLLAVGKKRWAEGTIEGTCRTVNQPKMINQRINRLQQSKRQEILYYHKLCEKYYRKSRKYMRNNSTKQKGKKNSTSHYRSKFRAQRYGDKLPKKVGKPWREKGKEKPFMQAWCQKDLPTLYQRRTGRQTHVMWTP